MRPGNASLARPLFVLLLVALAARLIWFFVLPPGAISVDLHSWIIAAGMLREGRNPYDKGMLNWPPFWMALLYLVERFCENPRQLYGAIRLILILSELKLLAFSFILSRRLNNQIPSKRIFLLFLFGWSLNPLLILLTVQHGNFDAIAMIWVILFLYFLIRFRGAAKQTDWLFAAGCLGMGIFTKTFPLVLSPLLIPGGRTATWRGRFLAVALLAGPTVLTLAPLYFVDRAAITRYVIHYRSVSGTFGITGILNFLGWTNWISIYATAFSCAMLIAMIALAVILLKKPIRRDRDIVLLSALILLATFVLGPGYGSQYWFWVVPLLLVIYPNKSPAFQRIVVICGLVIIATNIIECALINEQGRFLFWWFPNEQMLRMNTIFDDAKNVFILRLPMFAASLILLIAGVKSRSLPSTNQADKSMP